jgi:hypothetical protein
MSQWKPWPNGIFAMKIGSPLLDEETDQGDTDRQITNGAHPDQ